MSGRTSQRQGRAGELELTRLLQAHGYDVQQWHKPSVTLTTSKWQSNSRHPGGRHTGIAANA